MKIFILLVIFLLPFSKGEAFSRPDIDTVSILGITPGLAVKMLASHVNSTLDTLLWDEASGIGIVKFVGIYLGSKGDFRIAYVNGFVSQVSFVAPTKNQEETSNAYSRMSQELSSNYGPPDIETTNTIHEMRWEGMKHSISIKAVDGTPYVTIALSKFEMQK